MVLLLSKQNKGNNEECHWSERSQWGGSTEDEGKNGVTLKGCLNSRRQFEQLSHDNHLV